MESTNQAHLTRWLFDVNRRPSQKEREFQSGRLKIYLYESLHRSLTKHDVHECFQLLKVLPKETSLDPYVLFRFILILIECNPTEDVNKNAIFHLEKLFSKFNLHKPDAFVEFLSYFIRNNRIDDAKELFSHRYRHMSHKTHRIVPYVDINLHCYQFFLNYVHWSEKVSLEVATPKFDISIQGWIVNFADYIISSRSNHEYFLMCLVRLLLCYGFAKKAYIFVSEFQRNNPDNLSAQLLLYHLVKRLESSEDTARNNPLDLRREVPMDCDVSVEDQERTRAEALTDLNNFRADDESFELNKYPIRQDKCDVVKNLRRLDPCLEELLVLDGVHDDLICTLQDHLDGMEFVKEIKNIKRWSNIISLVERIFDTKNNDLINIARSLWRHRYRRYWNAVDFLDLAGSDLKEEDRLVIEKGIKILRKKLDRQSR